MSRTVRQTLAAWILGAGLTLWLAVFASAAPLVQPAAPLVQPAAPGWTAPAPIAPDNQPSLQSSPALALAGDYTLLGWTDSRNYAPDIYTVLWQGDQAGGEVRATNLSPRFVMQRALDASVVVESSGRAFAVYADASEVYLIRFDPAAARWSQPVLVTRDHDTWQAVARYPQVASDGAGDLVVVWEDDRNVGDDWASSRGSDIYASTCNGVALTCADANLRVNDDDTRTANGDQRRPQISRRGSQVAVVWEDQRDAGAEAPQVYAAFSGDGGRSWGTNLRVSPQGRGLSAMRPAAVYAADGSLFAAWEQRTGAATAPADIYAVRFDGAAWGAAQRVDAAPPRRRAVAPALAAGDAGVFVAWQDYRSGSNNADIYTARLDGADWTELPAATAPGMQTNPRLAASGGRVQLVWQDMRHGEPDIFTATWQADGWSAAAPANSAAARSPAQAAPALASNGGSIYALFLDKRKGFDDLWLTLLPTGALTWTAPSALPTGADAGVNVAPFDDWTPTGAQLAVDGSGLLQAVWRGDEWPYGSHIYYSVYQGDRWRDAVRLSGDTDDGRARYAPVVAARNGTTVVAWSEFDNSGDVQLYVTWNSGSGWVTPLPVLATALAGRWYAPSSLAMTDDAIFVAWSESDANGRGRVMVARLARGNPAAGWRVNQVSPDVASDWCAQQMPQVRADGAGSVHIVWAGCALRSPPDEWPHDAYIFYAVSHDGGATFGAPLAVAQTVAPSDDAYANAVVTPPALAPGATGEVMVVYPSRIDGKWTFYAARILDGDVVEQRRIGELTDSWTPEGEYADHWYGGDGPAAVVYDDRQGRFVTVFADGRNQRTTVLHAAFYGGGSAAPYRYYLPGIRR